MARGRLGGTKSKIRGKVGTDIYQLKRDPIGTLVQSVYGQNPNPTYTNTETQAKNRCIMGQIERMWHWLPQIIKDSFATVPRGALSFQRFSKLNYPLLREDFETHFKENNVYSWVPKREMQAPAGTWLLTDGTLPEVTWDDAVFSLGWNNGLEISWNKSYPNASYGDFLSNFGVKMGDRLILAIYRRDYPSLNQYVETWTFRPREDYSIDTPWLDVEDKKPFETNCPYTQVSGQLYEPKTFFWGIDTQDYPRVMKIACMALFIARDTDKGTLFSSSRFVWAQHPGSDGYQRVTPQAVFPSWLNK